MNILIVNRALGTLFGGGESFDYNAARHLMKRGHRVTMITGRPLLGAPRNTVSDVKVVHVPAPSLRRFAYMTEGVNSKLSAAFRHLDNALFEWAVWRWYSAQEAGAFDIVQCCALFSLPRRLLGAARQPVVSWLPGPPSGRVRRLLPGLIADRNFGLFTRGSPEWTLTKMGFERSRDYEIIEPGIDLATIDSTPVERDALRGTLGISADELCGVTTARLVPVKNLGLLLEGIAQAKRRGAIWQWLIIGDGPLESRLRQRARALGVLDQIHFLGHRPHAEVYRWLAAADLFALTSSYENFSNAALEAMASRFAGHRHARGVPASVDLGRAGRPARQPDRWRRAGRGSRRFLRCTRTATPRRGRTTLRRTSGLAPYRATVGDIPRADHRRPRPVLARPQTGRLSRIDVGYARSAAGGSVWANHACTMSTSHSG